MKRFVLLLPIFFFLASCLSRDGKQVHRDTILVIVYDTIPVKTTKKNLDPVYQKTFATVNVVKNVKLFVGVSNPVQLESNLPLDSLSLEIKEKHAKILVRNIEQGDYEIRALKKGRVTVLVKKKEGIELKTIREFLYIADYVPDPIPLLNNQRGGNIRKTTLQSLTGIETDFIDSMYCLKFVVTHFTISTVDKRGNFIENHSETKHFTGDQKSQLKTLKSGDKFYIEDIEAKGPDGKIRHLPPMMFRIK